METNTQNERNGAYGIVAYVALVIALAALFFAFRSQGPMQQSSGVMDRSLVQINETGVLRVGYGGFPPYTIINVNETDSSKRVQGFAVDLINEIARRHEPALRVEWHLVNWETLKADVLSKKFDVVVDPIYETIPRASDFGISDPYTYVGVGLGVVTKNETRFTKFTDLDRPDITISVAVGWTSTEFAKSHLTKPKWKDVSVAGSAFSQLDDVLAGRADVALQDAPTVIQYVRSHKDKVKALWVDSPPSFLAAGFLTRKEDHALLDFLNTSIRVLKTDGTIQQLDEKWKTYGSFEKTEYVPGAGLSEYLK